MHQIERRVKPLGQELVIKTVTGNGTNARVIPDSRFVHCSFWKQDQGILALPFLLIAVRKLLSIGCF